MHAPEFKDVAVMFNPAFGLVVQLTCGGDTGAVSYGGNVRDLESIIESAFDLSVQFPEWITLLRCCDGPGHHCTVAVNSTSEARVTSVSLPTSCVLLLSSCFLVVLGIAPLPGRVQADS